VGRGCKSSPPRRGGSTMVRYPGDFLKGAIDEVRIYNRPLTTKEIKFLLNHKKIEFESESESESKSELEWDLRMVYSTGVVVNFSNYLL
jgi:hypothetical protein